MHHHLIVASITAPPSTSLFFIEDLLGSEADLANILISLSQVLLILHQTVLKVSTSKQITARVVDKYLLSTLSIATLP